LSTSAARLNRVFSGSGGKNFMGGLLLISPNVLTYFLTYQTWKEGIGVRP